MSTRADGPARVSAASEPSFNKSSRQPLVEGDSQFLASNSATTTSTAGRNVGGTAIGIRWNSRTMSSARLGEGRREGPGSHALLPPSPFSFPSTARLGLRLRLSSSGSTKSARLTDGIAGGEGLDAPVSSARLVPRGPTPTSGTDTYLIFGILLGAAEMCAAGKQRRAQSERQV